MRFGEKCKKKCCENHWSVMLTLRVHHNILLILSIYDYEQVLYQNGHKIDFSDKSNFNSFHKILKFLPEVVVHDVVPYATYF